MHIPADLPVSLGADLRALRKARGLTLAAMAEALDRSVGWVSQIERDLSEPSIDDLKAIAALHDVPLSLFFGPTPARAGEEGRIVRADARRRIGTGGGLVEALLSPDLTGEFEAIHSVFRAGASQTAPVRRATEELGILTRGRLSLTIGEATFDLEEGDSFRIRGEPYSWENPHDKDAEAIWIIAPPVY